MQTKKHRSTSVSSEFADLISLFQSLEYPSAPSTKRPASPLHPILRTARRNIVRRVCILFSTALVSAVVLVGPTGCDNVPPTTNENGDGDAYVPTEQMYEEDENCPPGQTGMYSFDGTEFHLVDCEPFPSDLGTVCTVDEECEYNCITADEDLEALNCPVADCGQDSIPCHGIKGRCGPYGVSFRNIYQQNTVNGFCPE